VDAPNFKAATIVAGSGDDKGKTVEMTIDDAGTDAFANAPEKTMGVRMEVASESTPQAEPLLPRVLTPVKLVMDRGNSLPAGLKWKPQFKGRSVVPGEATKIRLTFNGNDEMNLKRVDLRTEGLAKDATASKGVPFPEFDPKNRAFVDYDTKVAKDASYGYRVLRANVVDAQGHTSVIESSYEIAPIITFDFVEKKNIVSSTEPQTVKFSTYIRSNTLRRVDGVFRVSAPEGWKIPSGEDRSFIIYNPRGSKRQVFSVVIPGGFKGSAPIKIEADIAGQHSEKTVWVIVN
jgi:hypothetical protein